MENETTSLPPLAKNLLPFGTRLRSAREALGMDRKDAAAHLRLHEKTITMMEKGIIEKNLPLTFVRGYFRSYSKLLNIPEQELKEALKILEPMVIKTEVLLPRVTPTPEEDEPFTSNPALMRAVTFFVFLTIISLVAIWWHTHKHEENATSFTLANVIDDKPAKAPSDSILTSQKTETPFTPILGEQKTTISFEPVGELKTTPIRTTSETNTPPNISQPTLWTKFADVLKTSWEILFFDNYFKIGGSLGANWIIQHIYYFKYLFDLILFMVILNLALHKYPYAIHTIFSKTHSTTTRFTPKPFRPLGRVRKNRLKISRLFKPKLLLVLAILSLVFFIPWKNFFSQPEKKHNPPLIRAKNQWSLFDNVEFLAPLPDLFSKINSSFKINSLQVLVNKLNNLINQANAVNFALTDPKNEASQFTYKKKQSHKRKILHNYNEMDDNYYDNGIREHYTYY